LNHKEDCETGKMLISLYNGMDEEYKTVADNMIDLNRGKKAEEN